MKWIAVALLLTVSSAAQDTHEETSKETVDQVAGEVQEQIDATERNESADAPPGDSEEGADGAADAASEEEFDLDAFLAEITGNSEYQKIEKCISMSKYRSVDIVDEGRMLFYPQRGKIAYLNHFTHKCSGIRRFHTIRIDARGTRLCFNDSVAVIDPQLGFREVGPKCRLGMFEEITRDQASIIKDALHGR